MTVGVGISSGEAGGNKTSESPGVGVGGCVSCGDPNTIRERFGSWRLTHLVSLLVPH